MANIKDLRVCKYSLDLAEAIHNLTKSSQFVKDFGLSSQIRRASVSVASNIAEGHERGTNKDSIRFFNIAKASVAEVITQLHITYRIDYIDVDTLAKLEDNCERIKASLINLIKARKLRDNR